MEKILVAGKKPLYGSVNVQGAKNSILPILAATLLIEGGCNISNAPVLSDVSNCALILKQLGAHVEQCGNTLSVKRYRQLESCIDKELMNTMRSSIFFLAPLLATTKLAIIYPPGGCKLGARPIDLHLEGLAKMGVNIREIDDKILCYAENGLFGADILLRFPSVGATETLMMAAVTATGRTILRGAAREPEVADLAGFLCAAGAQISGAGSDTITIDGVAHLHSCDYSIIPDRIETATFLCAVAAAGGAVEIGNTRPALVIPLLELLTKGGATVNSTQQSIHISCERPLSGLGYVKTEVYPGFATDAAPLLAAAMLVSEGSTVIDDTIFSDRFRCAEEFSKFGAKAGRKGSCVYIEGMTQLYGAQVKACDLRGGAALLVAALAAQGDSVIKNINFIKRGYENVVSSYQKLGACINYC